MTSTSDTKVCKNQGGLLEIKMEEECKYTTRQDRNLQKNTYNRDVFRKYFRQFCYQETSGPREALSRLRELCRQWLRPDLNSKEQILELLVLEQFLTILPGELQALVKEHQLQNGEEVVTLLEDLERQINVLGRPVSTHTHGHRVLWDEVIPSKSASEPPSIHVQSLATVPKSPVPQKPQDRGKRPDFTYNDGETRSENKELFPKQGISPGIQPHGEATAKCNGDVIVGLAHGETQDLLGKLERHQGNPTQERRHKCDECGKSFAQNSGLVRHWRIHTGEKPYQCTVCGKAFSYRSALLSHQDIHNKVKRYHCKECAL